MANHTTQGFTGTVDQAAWAKINAAGHFFPFKVARPGVDWLAFGHPSSARVVRVNPGTAVCCGVIDTTTTIQDVGPFPANTGSSTRIDAVVARFDWTTNQVTFAAVVNVGASPTPLTTGTVADDTRITQIPGVRYDGILAWVYSKVNVSNYIPGDVVPVNPGTPFTGLVRITSSQYNSLVMKDPNVLYAVVND